MKIFSLPLNPKLNNNQINDFLNIANTYKDYIYDIYFTSRIPPFDQDAMGDIFKNQDDTNYLIDLAVHIQNITGISISATFNNIDVPPTQENLDIFIKNFKNLYDKGIRSATIPHSHWVATGQIQKEFPELFIKNTILRKVEKANEIVELANIGFHYINLNRDLMRDADSLKEIKKAKEYCIKNNKPIKISLLINEGCKGNCPFMDEHYSYNLSRSSETPQYFNSAISRVSCKKWDELDSAIEYKTGIISPWKEDLDKYINDYAIDVFKLHGRESISRLYESFEIIKRYASNNIFLFPNFENYYNSLEDTQSIDIWRNKIQNCKFNCWSCGYCDTLNKNKIVNTKIEAVLKSLDDSTLSKYDNNIVGLTSQRIKAFLNSLGKYSKKYLEIGAYHGATFYSTIDNNKLTAFAIDLWEDSLQPEQNSDIIMDQNSMEIFRKNRLEVNFLKSELVTIKGDMNKVDTSNIHNIDLFFYDASHSYKDTYNIIKKYYKTFADETILVFDDANWSGVVQGVDDALKDIKANIIYKKILLNSVESESQWWNGLYILVIKKKVKYEKEYINLILTQECNKRCSFCFTQDYSSGTEMSLDFIQKILDHFPEIKKLNLLGGEPTNHSEFIKIINLLKENDKEYQLISNLLFNKNILNELLQTNTKKLPILANGMELNPITMAIFKKNWKNLDKKFDLYIALTIAENHTLEYFQEYTKFIYQNIGSINKIRIGLDLNGDYIINNKQIGEIIKIIWTNLSNSNTTLVFDCDIPPCIFDYNLEDLPNMNKNKYIYYSTCASPIMDIQYDGSAIYCYPLKKIKIDNIFDYQSISSILNKFIINYDSLKSRTEENNQCLKCKHYNKECSGLCLGCRR